MLTDLSWLDIGKPFPPPCAANRLERYRENKEIFEDDYESVYEEQWKRIERVIGNINDVVGYAVIANYQKLMSIKTADLAFGETPNITVSDNEKQAVIDNIIIDTDLQNYLYMSALDLSRYGDSLIIPTADGKIDVVSPAMWFPVVDQFNVRKFYYHVFAFVYLIDTKKKTYGLKVQIHAPEKPRECEERVYLLQGQMGSFIIKKDLSKRKEMKIPTRLDICPVFRVSNMLTSDRLFGIDDYRSVDSLVAELMVRISQVSKVLDKFSHPSMCGPQSALKWNDITQQYELKFSDYFVCDTEESPKPECITWDANLDANFKQIELIINQLYTISEMGSVLLGDPSNKAGQVASGTALRRLMMSPLAKAKRLTNRYTNPLKQILCVLAKSHGVDILPSEITITWNDGLPADPAEDAEIANIRTGGKATLSQYTAIQRLDNMSDSDVDAELEMIRADALESSAGTVPPLEPEDVQYEEI